MDKVITRSQLRGQPLDNDCKRANRSKHEYGIQDNRVFCIGLYDQRYDEILEKCQKCKAFVENAEPPKEEKENV